MRYYKHFQTVTACDWTGLPQRDGILASIFKLDIQAQYVPKIAGFSESRQFTVTLDLTLLGLAILLTIGRWRDYEREGAAAARDGMKETLRRRMVNNP